MGNVLSSNAWKRRIARWTGSSDAATATAQPLTRGEPKPATPAVPKASAKPLSPKLLAARAAADGIQFLVPEKALNEVLPNAEFAEVVMLPRLIRSHKWAMPEHELLVLGAITKQVAPKLVVEFGTFRGGSTLVITSNAAPQAKVITIDLDPALRKTHEHGTGTGLSDFDVGCLFRGTRYAPQIEQRFANSVEFMDQDLIGKADMILVDADHTYEFARRDTVKAMQFLKPGGTIVWHDYTWEPQNSECAGVTRTVNEFWQTHGHCARIAGTRFAIYQSEKALALKAA